MIYLDNNATTKPFPEVVEVMTQFMASRFWNASSAFGQLDGLEEVVETAKATIRSLIGAVPGDEVVFTSGATESNAWAMAEGARRTMGIGWLLSSQIEHPSVREPLENLQLQGMDVRYVPVTRNGTFDLDKLAHLIDSDLRFVSLIFAHNETGVIQPLQEAIFLIRERAPQCLIHTDATQAIGKIPISFNEDLNEVDLVSFSAHKFHGPKGIGGLVIRNGVQIKPFILGGGQQDNLRSGTLNIPAIAGASVAANLTFHSLEKSKHQYVSELRKAFEKQICAIFPNVFILGTDSPRLPNTSYFGIPGTDGEDLANALAAEGVVVSKASSCSAQSLQPSQTAMLMGYTYDEAKSLTRVSMSFDTTIENISDALKKISSLIS